MKTIPTTIDGVEYPSRAHAARALGVTRQTIDSRLRHPGVVGSPAKLVLLDGVEDTVRGHAARRGTDVYRIYRELKEKSTCEPATTRS